MCTTPPTPAIANAIYDAVGVRIDEMPFTPEKIRRALKGQGGALRRSASTTRNAPESPRLPRDEFSRVGGIVYDTSVAVPRIVIDTHVAYTINLLL